MEEEAPRAPPPQVRATIQRNHPVDQILGDISKGVTTHSRLANFCEHYSVVSSIEPFRVEEALQDSDWVLAMQEVLNNFKRNEVWSLVPRLKQNVVDRTLCLVYACVLNFNPTPRSVTLWTLIEFLDI
jgi:hypothetical protein